MNILESCKNQVNLLGTTCRHQLWTFTQLFPTPNNCTGKNVNIYCALNFLEFDDIMHQFYHAVRTSEGEESAEQLGKLHLFTFFT